MSSIRNVSTVYVRLKSDAREIAPVRDRYLSFLGEAGLEEKEIEGWKMVFTELVANAIKHGSVRSGDMVRVGWWVDQNTVWLSVRDNGNGPAEEFLENPSLPENPLAEGGRGLFLIGEFVDQWQHWRSPDGYTAAVAKTYPDITGTALEDPAMELVLDELADSYENLALYERLGRAMVEEESFSQFFRSCLRIFIEAGKPDNFHLETAGDESLPEFILLANEPSFQRFGNASNALWEILADRPYFVWSRNSAGGIPFSNGQTWCPEGCAVPIRHLGKTVGLLALGLLETPDSMRSHGVRNLQALGNIIGIGLSRSIMDREKSERNRIRHELNIATGLQQQLLPLSARPPSLPSWRLFVHCEPAQEVAGDFAEIRQTADHNLTGCIIDVMGKGVTAAILAGIFRSHFISYSQIAGDPAEFLNRVNRTLVEQLNQQTMFITATVFCLDVKSGQLQIASAGHPPTIIFQADGGVREWEAENPPLGLFQGEQYVSHQLSLHPGERLMLVTDGLYEWPTDEGQFGWNALVDWLKTHRKLSGQEILTKLRLLASPHLQRDRSETSGDDQTILIIDHKEINP